MTFFDWPVPREQRGTGSIVRTSFRVAGADGLAWWEAHLAAHGVTVGAVAERDGRLTLDFEDPEGQRLALVDGGGAGDAHPWAASVVPAPRQLRGLGPIVLSVPKLAATDAILQGALNMGPGGAGAEVHVAVQPGLPRARAGVGGAHHVAFRCPDAEYDAWADRLNTRGVPNSGEVDRCWFHSLYFREPNGILFEIATDGPGFGVDEDQATLGEALVLAPFLEPRRAEKIAAARQPIA